MGPWVPQSLPADIFGTTWGPRGPDRAPVWESSGIFLGRSTALQRLGRSLE